MNVALYDAVHKLTAITAVSPIDWKAFDEALVSIADINTIEAEYGETILTEVISDGDFLNRGEELVETIRHFLAFGYDVSANDGQNGGLALSALCWTSYDLHILEAAKLLMNAGAPVNYRSADDEPGEESGGLLASIEWKIPGAWMVDNDYEFANILDAYYEMAEANLAGKDYNAIYSYHDCIGKTVSKVTAIQGEDGTGLDCEKNITKFSSPIVIWFADKPLVVSPYVEFVANPIYANEHSNDAVDVSSAFASIIGATLEDVRYADSTVCCLDFSNGFRVLFASRDTGERKRIGTYEIRPITSPTAIESIDINCLCGRKGRNWADHVTDYEEDALALFGNDGTYLLRLVPGENQKNYQLKLLQCSPELLVEYTRQYPVAKPNSIRCFYEQDELTAMCWEYDDSFLYFKTDSFYEIEVQLSKDEYDPSACHSLHSKKGVHMDFKKRLVE